MIRMIFSIVDFEPRTLAFANDLDEAAANKKLDLFLASKGIVSGHRFQNEIVMKKNGLRMAIHLRYASVPAGTVKAGDVAVVEMTAGIAVLFSVPQDGYATWTDGGFLPMIDAFLKANGLGWDLSKVVALAERRADGDYDVLLPVKRK